MTRNLKALGLALIAVFAFGAVAASAASALTLDHFTSDSSTGSTVITGDQVGTEADNFFGIKSVGPLKITCKNTGVSLNGTVPSNSVTQITIFPTYKECTSNLGGATVTNEGCDFVLTGTTDEYTNTVGVAEGTDATVHVDCTAGKSITISTGGCILSITGTTTTGPNQNLLGVKYTNEKTAAGIEDIKVDVTVDNIHYTTNNAFACQLAGIPKTGNDGYLTQTVTATGFKDVEGSPTVHQDVFKDETPVNIKWS